MQQILWTTPLKLGEYTLKNRIVLASMCRQRCDPKTDIANDLVAQYYGQRSGAGLLLTQASAWSPRGNGYPGSADIWNKEQAQGWRKVTDRVHQKGGLIFVQLYHAGRATHPDMNGGYEVWAPSAVGVREEKIHALGKINFPVPKEMTLQDIKETLREFEESVKLAKLANFDGVQLHGANSYIIDQFLRSHTNRREDSYGGSPANRCRFVLQLIDIALKHFKPYQVGIKISPTSRFNDMFDESPLQTYSYLLQELSKRNIGFVQIVQSAASQYGLSAHLHIPGKQQISNVCQALRPYFKGIIFANNGFNPETGINKIRSGQCDAVSFARLHITNPDLTDRIINNYPLNTDLDYSTLYGVGLPDKRKGYTDYLPYKH